MTTTNPLSSLSTEQLIASMQRHVCIVSLSISYPRLSRQIDDAVVEVGDNESGQVTVPAEICTVPQWKLVPEEWAARFSKFDGQTRKILRQHSRRFGATRGAVLLPWAKVDQVFAELHSQRLALCGDPVTGTRGMCDDFIDEWPSHLAALRRRLASDVYARAVAKLPNASDLRAKFGIRVCTIPLAGGTSGVDPGVVRDWETQITGLLAMTPSPRVDSALLALRQTMTATRSAAAEASTSPIDMLGTRQLVAAAHDQLRDYVASSIEAMATEPRQRLAAALANLADACRTQGRNVRAGTLNQVREAFDYLRGFAFLADDELLAKMGSVQDMIDRTVPQELNRDTELAARFSAVIEDAATACRNTQNVPEAIRKFARLKL